jgi:hypothetical protein
MCKALNSIPSTIKTQKSSYDLFGRHNKLNYENSRGTGKSKMRRRI